MYAGIRPGWKKAVVQLKAGDSIEIFEGAQL
jgi:ribosomal protein L23